MWIPIGLAVGCIVYAVQVLGEYRTFLDDIGPRIGHLEQKAETIEQETNIDVKRQKKIVERVDAAKQLITQQQHEMEVIQEKIKTAKQRQEKLEMDMYKAEFKRSKRT